MSTVITQLISHASTTPHRIALESDGATLTYDALALDVQRLAAHLVRRRPRVIGVLMDNGPHWVICDLAAIVAQIPVVPIPAFFTPAQIAHVIGDAGIDVVMAERDFPGCTSETLDVAGYRLFWVTTGAAPKTLPHGTAKITYTSGTTGTPKGVCLSQTHLEQVAQSLVTVLGPELAHRHVAVLPLAILLENVAGLYPTLIAGATYAAPSLRTLGYGTGLAPDGPVLVATLQRLQATTCILVPEILRLVVATAARNNNHFPHLHFVAVGGARVAPTLIAQARSLGIPAYEGYGLSECGSVVALNTPSNDQPGTVGYWLPHVSLSIAPDGEIIIHNPGFLGYLGGADSKDTDFATGDIGTIDDAYLSVSGRKKNILITSLGRNIAPEWIESEFSAAPAIQQCVVFGDDADHLTALIAPTAPDITSTAIQAAIDEVNQRLPAYAQIGAWKRVAAFTVADGTLTANNRPRREKIQARDLPGLSVPTFFERLCAEVAQEQALLFSVPQIVDGLAGRITRQTYIDYLTEAYHHVKHTVPLLRETLARIPDDKAWLQTALQDYIAEETGHEQWILNDITHAGGDGASVARSQPRAATAAMVAFAYHYIREINPVGFFGMVFVLEGTSIRLASQGAQALMTSLQLPPNCFSYLSSHGALDLEHMDFFRDVVNRVTSPEDQAAIIAMAKAMFGLFADVFRSIPHTRGLENAA